MNSNRRRKVIMGGLVVVMAGWYGLTQWPPSASLAATEEEVVELEDTFEQLVAAQNLTESVEISSTLDSQRTALPWPADPFFRLGDNRETAAADDDERTPAISAEPAYLLTAIIGGLNPLAMINGRVVSVGDPLTDSVTVVAIDDLSVTLREPSGIRVLKLPE